MVAIRKHAPADATAESLALLADKIDSLDRRHGAAIEGVRQDVSILKGDVSTLKGDVSTLKGDVSTLKQGQAILMENQLDMNLKLNSKMDLILSRLGSLVP